MTRLSFVNRTQNAQIRQRTWFPTVVSAMVMALAGLGDTLLYPTLPLYATQFGIPLLWVGGLLSVNKLIRLGGNHVLAFSISSLGYKRIATVGVLMAAASTFAYGLQPPIAVWLFSRIAWGLAFAALRLCALGYATETKRQGLNLGISKSIKEFGPMCALFIGPILITKINVYAAFQLFGLITLLALPLTWLLPNETEPAKLKMSTRVQRPTWFDGLICVVALADGILVVTIGLLLLRAGIDETAILGLSAFFLAVKRLSVIVVGPASGWLADKWQIHTLFFLSIAGFVIALLFVAFELTIVGITILFLVTAINQTVAAGVALAFDRGSKLNVLSALTSWRDLGTAVGALVGGYLLTLGEPSVVYGGLALIVLFFGLNVGRSQWV